MTHDELADRLEALVGSVDSGMLRGTDAKNVCDELRSLAVEARTLGVESDAVFHKACDQANYWHEQYDLAQEELRRSQ